MLDKFFFAKFQYSVSLIPLLGMYPKEMESVSPRDICIPLFIGALLTMGKIWKQPVSIHR